MAGQWVQQQTPDSKQQTATWHHHRKAAELIGCKEALNKRRTPTQPRHPATQPPTRPPTHPGSSPGRGWSGPAAATERRLHKTERSPHNTCSTHSGSSPGRGWSVPAAATGRRCPALAARSRRCRQPAPAAAAAGPPCPAKGHWEWECQGSTEVGVPRGAAAGGQLQAPQPLAHHALGGRGEQSRSILPLTAAKMGDMWQQSRAATGAPVAAATAAAGRASSNSLRKQ